MLENIRSVPIADYDTVEEAVRDYLDGSRGGPVRRAVFGIANPVLGDRLHMTNATWSFSFAATRQALNLDHLRAINDFTAQIGKASCRGRVCSVRVDLGGR